MVTVNHTSQGNEATLRWLLYDGHGNLVRTMAPDYTLSDWQFRGVWGEVQGNLALGRGYCANLGHPEDETGLVYMRARYYEPATGRFISEDPARDGVNWYLYADGNPVRGLDPSGQSSISEVQAGLFSLGLIFAVCALGMLYMNWKLPDTDPGRFFEKRVSAWKTIMNEIRTLCRISVFCFAGAAIGLSTPLDWTMWILGGVEMVLDHLIRPETQAGLRTAAGLAVAAAFTYALLLAGFLVATEVAWQEGR